MLHAEIRSRRDALHFVGELSGYNLQTLRQHMTQVMHDSSAVRVHIQVAPSELPFFQRHACRWLPALQARGAIVEVTVDSGKA
jgi:hypothetical protein